MSKKEAELFDRAQAALTKAEENLVKSFNKAVKEFSERLTDVQGEAKRRFDEALEQFGVKEHDAMAKVTAVRHGLETKVEQGTEAFWSALGLATKGELQDTQRKVTQLQKRVKELEGKGAKRSVA